MTREDLHIHSCYSDGTDSPDEIVRTAKHFGITRIALTDHNTVRGIPEFRAACRNHGVDGIAGIELSSGYSAFGKQIDVHVLGYFDKDPDLQDPAFRRIREWVETFAIRKREQNEAIIRKMIEAEVVPGLSVQGFCLFLKETGISNPNRVHIARYLIHLGAAGSIEDAMEHFTGTHTPYYVCRESSSMAEAIDAVKSSGGRAVIAHAGEYSLSAGELRGFLEEAVSMGADGFELEHPKNDADVRAVIRSYSDEVKRIAGRELLLTSGSDYHGANKAVSLGETSYRGQP